MKQNMEDFIMDLLKDLKENCFLDASHIPNIELYMDQVTTFMDDHLDLFKRSDEDKTLTKTMINNYTKSHLLPPSNKKKYSRDHMLLLLFIFYLKPILSIPDIQRVLEPLQQQLLDGPSSISLEDFYNTVANAQLQQFDGFSSQILETYETSKKLFPESGEKDDHLLSVVSVIYMLSVQASMQKRLVTQLIDTYFTSEAPRTDPQKENKKNKRKAAL